MTARLVLFDTGGGRRTGVGHLLRSTELVTRLRERGLDVGWVSRPRGARVPRSSPAPSRTAAADPAVLVVDRPDVSAALLRASHRRWPSAAIVALDYYGPRVPGVAAVVNLNLGRANRWPASTRPAAYVEGLAFATLRASFARARQARPGAPAAVGRILIGFGGTDPHGWTLPALQALTPIIDNGARADVLCGVASADVTAIGRHQPNPNVRVHVGVADPASLFARCDLAVIGGGTMMIEAACLGVPAVVVPRTAAERLFVRQFVAAGAVRALAARGRFPARALRNAVAELVGDRATRARMRCGGRALIDGRGADRIVRLILDVLRTQWPGPERSSSLLAARTSSR